MTVEQATRLLANEAERLGATPGDESGIVRDLVTAHGLSFNAWFVVCCELADRDAIRHGFKNQADRAASRISDSVGHYYPDIPVAPINE